MDRMMDLAERHVLESAARLRHIDELMAQARTAPVEAAQATQVESLLRQIEVERDRLAHELEAIRRLPRSDASDKAKRGEGLQGLLTSVGLQLEQVLGAIFERDKHPRRGGPT